MNRRHVLFAGMGAAMFAPLARAEGAEITLNGALAFVPVSIAGSRPVLFLIDTGATVTLIDGAFARAAGLYGPLPAGKLVRAPKSLVSAAGLSRTLEPVLLDLGKVANALKMPVSGALGSDFLSGFNVRLDLAAKTLSLTATNPNRPPGAFHLRFDDMPFIRASLRRDGKVLEGEFGLDTGLDSFAKLDSAHAERTFPGLTTTSGFVVTAAGEKPRQIAKFDALNVGGLDISGAATVISTDSPPRGAGPDYLGMIGAPALAGRVLTLDVQSFWASLSPVIM